MTALTYSQALAAARHESQRLLDDDKPVQAVLTLARALVGDEEHWIKGTSRRQLPQPARDRPEDVEYCFCASGAIDRAVTTLIPARPVRDVRGDAYEQAARMLRTTIPRFWEDFGSIPVWNDQPLRTYDEVRQVMDEALERARVLRA